jgi:hypothetical protein
MAVLGHCVRQADNRASMTAESFLAFGFLIGIELEGIPGRDCRCEVHRVVEEQLSGFGIEILRESQATLQHRHRSNFIRTRKNSRYMHQCRGSDSRFRALRLFARRKKKSLRHIRRILLSSKCIMGAFAP